MARGGLNWAANIVPSCGTCNVLKQIATEEEYTQLMGTLCDNPGWLPPAAHSLLAELSGASASPQAGLAGDALEGSGKPLGAPRRPPVPWETRQVTLLREVLYGGGEQVFHGPQSALCGTYPRPVSSVLLDPPPLTSYSHTKGEAWVLDGSQWATQIAGVKHRSDAVKIIAGGGYDATWGGWGYLLPEHDNPHDRDAVRVMVRGRHVGYLAYGTLPQVRSAAQTAWAGGCLPVVRVHLARSGERVWGKVALRQGMDVRREF